MHPLENSATLVTWAGKNTAYNLGFIADDKLNWKPAPTAKSALEIAAEVVHVVRFFQAALQNQTAESEPVRFETREDAQATLESTCENFAQFLLSLTEADLEGEVSLPFIGTIPKKRALLMPVTEAIHHHGQIVYIQTLLGDDKSHFYEMGN